MTQLKQISSLSSQIRSWRSNKLTLLLDLGKPLRLRLEGMET